jgi:putative acetyltransferase
MPLTVAGGNPVARGAPTCEAGGMEIRAAADGDAPAVRRVIEQAFGGGPGGEGEKVAVLWADVVAGGHVRASLVAVDGDEVVGHVGVSHAWLDARRALVDVAVLSPLSVLPDHQGRGAGTALVAAAIEAGRTLGVPALFLEGAPDYYGARGFRRGSGLGFRAPTPRTPDPAFQVVVYDAHEEWMTGPVVYRDVWWSHDAAGLRDPDLAEIERNLGTNRTGVR